MSTDFAFDLNRIVVQERDLQFPSFDSETGWRLGMRLRTMALSRDHAVAIDIRRFAQPIFYAALADSTPNNFDWVRRKSNLVQRFYRSSYSIGLTLQRDGTNLLDRFGLSASDYMAHGGSFPLAVKSAGVIGSITVSGLPQRADHELVVEALCLELDNDYTALALPMR